MADPLSRHPLIVAHMMLCALEHGEDGDLMADSDIVAEILAGYANDPWFAEKANIAKEDLRFDSGAYYKGPALAVPNIAAVRAGILQELHDSNYAGHVGIYRTLFNVKRIYWWPDMARHIREYVQGCDVCQRNKNLQRQPVGKLMPLPTPTEACEVVSMDRMEAAQQRQKRYADEHRSDLSFNVGDKVLLSSEHIPLRAVGRH